MTLRDEIIIWNADFPIDRWWRKKYNIPFGSKTHMEANFLDQVFEYEEDKMFEEFSEESKYVPNSGNFMKEPEFKDNVERQRYNDGKMQDFYDGFDDEIKE